MSIVASEPISTAYFINPSHRFVCMCIPQSLPGNSSVKSYRRNDYTSNSRRTVGRVVFYTVSVASKKSRRLVLPITYCLYRDVDRVWFEFHVILEVFWTNTKIKIVQYLTDTTPNSNGVLSVILDLKLVNRNYIFIMPSYHAHRINNTEQYIFIRWHHTFSCTRRNSFLSVSVSALVNFGFVYILVSTERCMTLGDGCGLWKEVIYM
jgi:hypothetical protein